MFKVKSIGAICLLTYDLLLACNTNHISVPRRLANMGT